MPPSLPDVKNYLGLTTTADDALITSLLPDAVAAVERDTGRTFASGSNSQTKYSTDGNSSLVIHDRPLVDASRVVTLWGVTMVEDTNVWFLPDRRDPSITSTIQLRYFDRSRADWYKASPNWFDANLDNPRWFSMGSPNDLSITGIIGHPSPKSDVLWAMKYQAARLYYVAKSGAAGVVYTPAGDAVSVDGEATRYSKFVQEWRIRTAVVNVG